MRSRLFAATVTALTVVLLGVSAGESGAQTPSTVFVGVVTVTSPPAVAVPPTPTPQVTGRRTVSCRTYYRGHGKRRHVTKRVCRKRRGAAVSTRRTVQAVSDSQVTFVVPPPPTFVVAPPPPTFVIAPPPPLPPPPPPVFVVNVAVASVVKHSDDESRRSKNDKKERAHRESKAKGNEKDKERGNGKRKDRSHDDD